MQDGLGAAYAVSSSPELLRYRASTMGGATLYLYPYPYPYPYPYSYP